MSVFRDSSFTLLHRVARLERENLRLRRRIHLRRLLGFHKIFKTIAECVGVFIVVSAVVLGATLVIGILCAILACVIGGIQ